MLGEGMEGCLAHIPFQQPLFHPGQIDPDQSVHDIGEGLILVKAQQRGIEFQVVPQEDGDPLAVCLDLGDKELTHLP